MTQGMPMLLRSLSWLAVAVLGSGCSHGASSSSSSSSGSGGATSSSGSGGATSSSSSGGVSHPAASCQTADVNAAIAAAAPGDTVVVPPGDCTWSASTPVVLSSAITLKGSGVGVTNITIGMGPSYSGVIALQAAGATVEGFTIDNTTQSYPVYAGANGFRITGNKLTGMGYGIRVGQAYGLIDANEFALSGGEFIQTVGPCDSWQTDDSFGGADNVFVENNLMSGGGYVTCNADARCVFRYNDVTGSAFFEAHQKCTNTNVCPGGETHRGPRELEVYGNLWSTTSSYFDFVDLYGGTGRIYDNVIVAPHALWLMLGEYTGFEASGCWDYSACNCTWPAKDQVGAGRDPLVGGSDPAYVWNNLMGTSMQDLQPVSVTLHDASTCAVAGQCGTSFSMSTIVQEGRDYFASTTKPAALASYTPYTCPHPLTGAKGSCDSSTAGRAGYHVMP